MVQRNVEKETFQTITEEYVPSLFPFFYLLDFDRPVFLRNYVHDMLKDPRIIFGLELLKGPVRANSRFYIDCENEEVKKFVAAQINRFWTWSAGVALQSIEWGYSGSEVIYDYRDGKIQFDKLRPLLPLDCRAVTHRGKVTGFTILQSSGQEQSERDVSPRYVGNHKCFWHVHWKTEHPYYGQSRLKGSFEPWMDFWLRGGYRDIRRLWFHKNAFEGGIIYYPPGFQNTPDGQKVSHKEHAQELIAKKKSGGVLALPSLKDENGNRLWEYIPPVPSTVPNGLLEFGDTLKDEIWEGMCIPPEVIRNEGVGAFAGRRVPQTAFYAILQDVVLGLITDFDEQVLRWLVYQNFGDVNYEIQPFGLLREVNEDGGEENATPVQPEGGEVMANTDGGVWAPRYSSRIPLHVPTIMGQFAFTSQTIESSTDPFVVEFRNAA